MRMCGPKEKQENDEQGRDLLSDMKWVFWFCFFLCVFFLIIELETFRGCFRKKKMIRSVWKEFKKEGHTHNCAHENVGSDQYMYKDKG